MNKEQILIGSILGDATIPKLLGRAKSYKITWEHSLEQREYAIWKAENSLENYSIYERNRIDKRTNKTYSSITVYSRVDNYKKYRDIFYIDGIKTVSNEVLELLTPLSIAVWYMDDGSLYYNGNNCHLTLSIDSFDNKEEIINYFKCKYNINFKITGKGKRIRLTSIKEIKIFENYFKEFIPKCMEYKTLDYVKNVYNNNLSNDRKKYRRNEYK